MKLKIEINMDNAAFFDEDDEPRRNEAVAAILQILAAKIESAWEMEDGHGFPIMDANGNKVGQATVEGE